MSSLRPEVHVAQQIRRDKLRILNSNSQHLQEFPNNQLEQLSPQQGLNLDLLQVRNVRNGNNNNNNMLDEPPAQALYSSEMITLSTASNPLSVELGSAEVPYRLMIMPHHYGSFPHSSSSIHNSSPKEQQCEPRGNLGNWRNSGPHDWMVNYATSSVANQSNNPHSFLANELNNDSNVPTHHQHYMKPSCHNNVLTDVQSSQNSTCGEMHYPNSSSSNSLYQNALQDMASLMHQAGHGTWGGKNNAGEPVLHHPIYGGIANLWTNRSVDNSSLRWSSPLGFTDKKVNDSNPHQGLSLSLSSNSQSRPCGEGSASDHDPHQSRSNISKDHQYAKYVKSNTMMKPSNNVSRDCGKSLQDPMGLPPPNTSYSSVGPLGPFTGYATILKSSRFLKPCQQLLDEYCSQCGPKLAKACDVPEWVFRDVSASTTSANAVNVDERGVAEKGSSNAGASSSMFYDSMDNSTDGGAASNFSLSSRPECQKNKAKLLYMQEEVTRRYKQYHQQMQMVVSSFESVAGLNSATPCISLALKLVSRHFRCLKNAISDQLKLICEALGEALSMPTTSASSKFDTNMARLRCMDQSFQRNKSGNMDFVEPQQHVWRPQRGLPERSVAILKAWLFEHFLHPYPTDTDKHMLATQTGLSRNQVSNWFINARVRVWKPMVEEIHMLETKVMVGADRSSSKNEGTSASEGSSSHPRVDQPLNNKFGTHAANAIPEKQFRCFEMGSSSLASANDQENGLSHEEEQWSREKRSKLECQNITSGMDGTLMGFIPFRRGSLEVGGLGPVSLTLGLRHGVEGAQQQQQQQQQLQHEEQLRHHFGGRMIHDFVG